jgi:predicted alpha/beta-hydrolase family hydrolase
MWSHSTPETAMRGHIILSHGSDSAPDAIKVSVLAALAEGMGWRTERPDYRQDDALGHVASVEPRLARLGAAIAAATEPPILVGSSMGAFVSGLASLKAPVRGLFLLALPAGIPGYPLMFDQRRGVPSMLVHGFRDELCPAADALEFAGEVGMPTLMLDDDHRLGASVEAIADQFRLFLHQVAGTTAA